MKNLPTKRNEVELSNVKCPVCGRKMTKEKNDKLYWCTYLSCSESFIQKSRSEIESVQV